MKILLAPAETKIDGGEYPPYCKENFKFDQIFDTRNKIVSHYNNFITTGTLDTLCNWFGLKNQNECSRYSTSILNKPTIKAIQRYTGVAFDALGYESLNKSEQNYCDENIIIFSNLFGPLLASDLIPDYKYKQGSVLTEIDTIKEYKTVIKDMLDNYIGEEVIDLRAGFYDKFYKPSMDTITYKFLKDGKVVSHWAKHYRGLVVKELAKHNIKNFNELMELKIEGLELVEIQQKKNIKTLIMKI